MVRNEVLIHVYTLCILLILNWICLLVFHVTEGDLIDSVCTWSFHCRFAPLLLRLLSYVILTLTYTYTHGTRLKTYRSSGGSQMFYVCID